MIEVYNVKDWYWSIDGLRGRYYSSALRNYVTEKPDAPITHIGSKEELWDVLRQQYPAGLPDSVAPASVYPSQAKIALHEAGLLNQVEELVEEYPYAPVRIWWNSALAFEWGHPYITAIGYELGLSDDAMAQLFITASKR